MDKMSQGQGEGTVFNVYWNGEWWLTAKPQPTWGTFDPGDYLARVWVKVVAPHSPGSTLIRVDHIEAIIVV